MKIYVDDILESNSIECQAVMSFFSAFEKKLGIPLALTFELAGYQHKKFDVSCCSDDFKKQYSIISTSGYTITWRHVYYFIIWNYIYMGFGFELKDLSGATSGKNVHVHIVDASSPEALKFSCDMGMISID